MEILVTDTPYKRNWVLGHIERLQSTELVYKTEEKGVESVLG